MKPLGPSAVAALPQVPLSVVFSHEPHNSQPAGVPSCPSKPVLSPAPNAHAVGHFAHWSCGPPRGNIRFDEPQNPACAAHRLFSPSLHLAPEARPLDGARFERSLSVSLDLGPLFLYLPLDSFLPPASRGQQDGSFPSNRRTSGRLSLARLAV